VGALPSLGRFDVVIAHGLLSWVPQEVAERMLAWVGASLADGGVLYLSYNVAAGWRHRGRLRHWLLEHVCGDSEEARVASARALLAEAPAELASLAAAVAQESDAYLSQDYLARVNHAFAYDALARRLAVHGLRPLCDANGASVELGGPWLPQTRAASAAVGDDPVAMGAWLDQQEQRAFRSTVFGKAGPLQRRGPAGMWFTSELRRVEGAALHEPGPTRFASAWGVTATIADPGVKHVLGQLAEAWPRAVPFDQLADRLGQGAEPVLSVLVGSNLVHPRTRPGPAPISGLLPTVPADVRAVAAEGASWAADLHHRGRRLDDADRALLPLLDGTRSEPALMRHLGWSAQRLEGELRAAVDRGLRLA
jgi:hypothetical protein